MNVLTCSQDEIMQEDELLQNEVDSLEKDLENVKNECRRRLSDNQIWIEENQVKMTKFMAVVTNLEVC
jgi:dynactin complex subunit